MGATAMCHIPFLKEPLFNVRTNHLTLCLGDLLWSFSLFTCSDQSKVLSLSTEVLSVTFKCMCCQLLSLSTLFTQISHNRRCDSVCIHCMHQWLHQFCCTLNKDSETNDDHWLKYPIISFDAVLQSLLIPCFVEAMFLQSSKTPMWNSHPRFFIINI